MIGQIVFGSPGCGKTSFCCSIKPIIQSAYYFPIYINLDPGNIVSNINFDINIQKLIYSNEIIPELSLGPNGSLIFSIEYFEKNCDWFEIEILKLAKKSESCYLIFDLPGQIELFTHHLSIRNFIRRILTLKLKLSINP